MQSGAGGAAMNWSWWPAAGAGLGWRPYPGVWLLVAAVAVASWLLWRRLEVAEPSSPGALAERRRRVLYLVLGLVLLWAALDWPLGAFGAGQSLSARAIRYLTLTLAAAPLLLLGLPPWTGRLTALEWWWHPLRLATHPVAAAGLFGLVLVLTHLPAVVDALEPHEAGSFAISVAWLVSALLLWVPVIGPSASLHRLPYLAGLGFLFLPFVLPKAPGLVYILSDDPLYEVYSTAASPWGWSAAGEQAVAGFVLWIIGSVFILVALAVLFFRWYAEDARMSRPDSLGVPADPHAVDLLFEVPGGWAAVDRLSEILDDALYASRHRTRHSGAEIGFGFRELHASRGAQPEQVVLELRLAVTDHEHRRLSERIQREYGAYLGRLDGSQREALERRLDVRVVRYGSRVG